MAFQMAGYQLVHHGEGRWNGVAIALREGLALVPATATVMATSIFLTWRLLPKLGVKRMLLLGLGAMGVGQAWLP